MRQRLYSELSGSFTGKIDRHFLVFSLQLTKTVFDIDDPTFLSLEQQKEKENEERKKSISNENKDKVKNKIEELRNEFNEISKK